MVKAEHESRKLAREGRAGRYVRQLEAYRALLSGPLPPSVQNAGNGHRVHESLFDRPIVTVGAVRELTGTSFAAANQLVARMTELGILREITGYSRNRRFRYEQFVRLFTDDADEQG